MEGYLYSRVPGILKAELKFTNKKSSFPPAKNIFFFFLAFFLFCVNCAWHMCSTVYSVHFAYFWLLVAEIGAGWQMADVHVQELHHQWLARVEDGNFVGELGATRPGGGHSPR